MPILKQQIKRAETDLKRAARNKAVISKVKTVIKGFEKTLTGADVEAKQVAYAAASRELDKAASKGALHRNNASRRKSRLAKRLNAAQA
jgi:small subunit ribosomal protein S20